MGRAGLREGNVPGLPSPVQLFALAPRGLLQIHSAQRRLAGYLEFSQEFLDKASESDRIDLLKK